MTPAARIEAAIGVLDRITSLGEPAEQELTRWARGSRYAGSGDRRAVRDHVFDVLRAKRSFQVLGGGTTGRALMLGLLRAQGADLDAIFTGARHQPAPLTEAERALPSTQPQEADRWNLPDSLMPIWRADLGPDAEGEALALQARAPVFLRVNITKTDRSGAMARLASDGITAAPHAMSPWALEVTEGAPKLRQSSAYTDGLVELQDAASQAVVAALPDMDGTILDYCAGGGGKTLALAARYARPVEAWDIAVARMGDLPDRAARAGAEVTCHDRLPAGHYDLVLADAPCSGSGAWRRSPDAKWRITPADLDRLRAAQDTVLDGAVARVAPGGLLAYATCSVLARENEARVEAFMARNPGWKVIYQHSWRLRDGADGFYTAQLTRE